MPTITLPNKQQQHYEQATTPAEVAAAIGAGLARAALAAEVNGELVDLTHTITDDAEVTLLTAKDEQGLEVLRHSCAHLLAHAVKQLYPTAQVTIGPVIADGFYYDFAHEAAFTPDDIAKIEQRMKDIAKQDIAVERLTMERDEAVAYFRELGEHYKAEIIQSIPAGDTISLYRQGDFTDLCRGPHVSSTGKIKVFKLTKHAGAYWRGDANNEMLQRVYGTAWASKEDLHAYLTRLEEAAKRDHRLLGKNLDLFHLQEEAPGMVFWHPDGFTVYQLLENYLRQKYVKHGYQEIRTPVMADKSLWERSGHIAKFGDEMFMTESENRDYAVKPMSCPLHIEVFKQGVKSYRDLPLRLAEFGLCHRCEPSGALHGLLRVRGFVQDDAHIFCQPSQIREEVARFNQFLLEVYQDFGFEDVIVYLSTRPEKRVGSDDLWDKAEADLGAALTDTGMKYEINPGEGAFYGPKIEYSLKDAIGRIWQLGTLQLDYCLPERLGAQYVAEDGSRQVPPMLHRAIFGTFERFLGILIEHYAGKFPAWLAPKQVVIMSITDNQHQYAEKVAENLKNHGFRVKTDLRNEKIGFKIREHTLQRIPYLVVLGDREVENESLAVRSRNGDDLGSMTLPEFCQHLEQAIALKGRPDDNG